MFGKNEISKARTTDFLVHSMFYTIQGEGPWAGMPTIFVRLAGCNLRCFWCDTDFAGGTQMSVEELDAAITKMSAQHRCERVVITGGEPLLQPLQLLFKRTANTLRMYQIETAGTVWPDGLGDHLTRHSWGVCGKAIIVLSPKTPKVRPEAAYWAAAWKYIVGWNDYTAMLKDQADGLPIMSTQAPGVRARPARPWEYRALAAPVAATARTDMGAPEIYVQALDEQNADANKANLDAAASIALAKGYRLSIQMHKLAGLE